MYSHNRIAGLGTLGLTWGLKWGEFQARHDNARIFRALWNSGYWARDGASEIPSGMTTQDYYIYRFNATPMWGDSEEILDKFRKSGTPLSSLRMTMIPVGMPWPPADIGTVSTAALQRVLPLAEAPTPTPLYVPPPAPAPTYSPAPVPSPEYDISPAMAVSSLEGALPLLLVAAVGGYLLLRKR